MISKIILEYPISNLFGSLTLLLAVLEIGEPDPVEDEDRHTEDEEQGEGLPPPLDGAVAEQHLGGQQAQTQQDVHIPVKRGYDISFLFSQKLFCEIDNSI